MSESHNLLAHACAQQLHVKSNITSSLGVVLVAIKMHSEYAWGGALAEYEQVYRALAFREGMPLWCIQKIRPKHLLA